MTEISGVAKEIERKFLIADQADKKLMFPFTATSYFIHHGWLPGTVILERFTKNSQNGTEFWRAIKAGTGLERIEAQERITSELFEAIWPLTLGKRVHKTRFCVPEDNLLWEVDLFNDRELMLAEIEIPTVETLVPIPTWLQPFIIREVTNEPEFLNVNLAK